MINRNLTIKVDSEFDRCQVEAALESAGEPILAAGQWRGHWSARYAYYSAHSNGWLLGYHMASPSEAVTPAEFANYVKSRISSQPRKDVKPLAVRVRHSRHLWLLIEQLVGLGLISQVPDCERAIVREFWERASSEDQYLLLGVWNKQLVLLNGLSDHSKATRKDSLDMFRVESYEVISYKVFCGTHEIGYHPFIGKTTDSNKAVYAGDTAFVAYKVRGAAWTYVERVVLTSDRIVEDHCLLFQTRSAAAIHCNQQNSAFKRPTAVRFNSDREVDEIKKYIGVEAGNYTHTRMIAEGKKPELYAAYLDRGCWTFDTVARLERLGYEIIDYNQFADAIASGCKYIGTSEDGVRIYEGDELFQVTKRSFTEYGYATGDGGSRKACMTSLCFNGRHQWHGFATKEAADAFIKQKNAPVVIKEERTLNDGTLLTVNNDGIHFTKTEDGEELALMLSWSDWYATERAVDHFRNAYAAADGKP